MSEINSINIENIITLPKLSDFANAISEVLSGITKISFGNGIKIWVEEDTENDNTPYLYISNTGGKIFKLGAIEEIQDTVYMYLLSDGGVYSSTWLKSNKNYVRSNMSDLYILKIFDSETDIQNLENKAAIIDFDKYYDFSISGGEVNMDTSADLVSFYSGKYHEKDTNVSEKKPYKDDNGFWYIPPYNEFGQQGSGFRVTFNYEDHDSIRMPEFEYVTEENGSYYIKAKDPSTVITDPVEGDIYPLYIPDIYSATAGRLDTSAGEYSWQTITIPIPKWHQVKRYNGSAWEDYTITDSNYIKLSEHENWYSFTNDQVVDIQQGKNFTVFLLSEGNILTCGANNRGQLGKGIETAEKRELLEINPRYLDIEGFSGISVEGQTWIAISADGLLYGCGANSFGQLGLGHCTDVGYLTPIAENVERALLTAGNLLIRKYDGKIYGCGYNLDDRLHLGTGYQRCVPNLIRLYNNWEA